jgi:hypothetical protein
MNEKSYLRSGSGLLLLVVLMAGCGRGLPPTMDSDEARSAVVAALDAWKNGVPPATLREREPPVDFRDLSWDQGSKLTQYDLEKEEPAGVSVKVTVKLHLTETSGARRLRSAVYSVDAGPVIVIRPDSLQLD